MAGKNLPSNDGNAQLKLVPIKMLELSWGTAGDPIEIQQVFADEKSAPTLLKNPFYFYLILCYVNNCLLIFAVLAFELFLEAFYGWLHVSNMK